MISGIAIVWYFDRASLCDRKDIFGYLASIASKKNFIRFSLNLILLDLLTMFKVKRKLASPRQRPFKKKPKAVKIVLTTYPSNFMLFLIILLPTSFHYEIRFVICSKLLMLVEISEGFLIRYENRTNKRVLEPSWTILRSNSKLGFSKNVEKKFSACSLV